MLPRYELYQLDSLIIIRTMTNTIILKSAVRNAHITSAARITALFFFEQACFTREISILCLENLKFVSQVSDKVFCLLFQNYVP